MLNEMYNEMNCCAATFDPCNILLSYVHTVLVNILHFVSLYLNGNYYFTFIHSINQQ